MNTLVKFIGNDVFTDSMIIADGTDNEHKTNAYLAGIRRKGGDVNEIVKINGRDCPGKSGSWFIPNIRFNEEGERG